MKLSQCVDMIQIVRSSQVMSGQVRSGQVRSGQVRSGQVRSGQVGWDQVRSRQVRPVRRQHGSIIYLLTTGQIDQVEFSGQFLVVLEILLFDVDQEHAVTARTVLVHV